MLTMIERPLTPDERQQLIARVDRARVETRTALLKTGLASAGVCAVLAIATLLASTAPAVVVVGFWAALALLFTLWIGMPWRRLMREQVQILEDALRTSRARDLRLQSTRVVEFEEEEDEGACYAFEHEPGACIFIVGQEFYEDDDFPSSDFSMVEILGSHGSPADVLLVKHGRRLHPERVVPASIKARLELPGHLTAVAASLERLEDALRAR
jgi:hypothetical protein